MPTNFGERLARLWPPILATLLVLAGAVTFYGSMVSAMLKKEAEISFLEMRGYCDSNFLSQDDFDRQMRFRDQKWARLESQILQVAKQHEEVAMNLKVHETKAHP